jgi:hypothetical protein
MAISRDGNSEYVSNQPTFEEKVARLEEEIKKQLEQTPAQLELKGRYFAADEMTILAQSEQVRSVRTLDLSDNQIDDAGLKALFEAATLEQLEELSLSINFITTVGEPPPWSNWKSSACPSTSSPPSGFRQWRSLIPLRLKI